MRLSKGDFNEFITKEQLAYARHTELEVRTDVSEGIVKYVVTTQLEDNPFNHNISTDAKTYSRNCRVFDDLDEAIELFNKIQDLAEKGELVHVVGV